MAPAQLTVMAAVQGGLAALSGGGTKKGRIFIAMVVFVFICVCNRSEMEEGDLLSLSREEEEEEEENSEMM